MEQEEFINSLGEELADTMKLDFYGSVRFNIQGGRYTGANIERSVRPEKVENGKEEKVGGK
jgi:hypothetical protein